MSRFALMSLACTCMFLCAALFVAGIIHASLWTVVPCIPLAMLGGAFLVCAAHARY